MKFYRCEKCGRIIYEMQEVGHAPVCCGEEMKLLDPKAKDGAVEKHVPVVTVEGSNVKVVVGSVEHPMLDNHYIMWIAVETTSGAQIAYLKPGEKPAANFVLPEGQEVKKVYGYCNLHGLWEAE
jgi:superoxide reductase